MDGCPVKSVAGVLGTISRARETISSGDAEDAGMGGAVIGSVGINKISHFDAGTWVLYDHYDWRIK